MSKTLPIVFAGAFMISCASIPSPSAALEKPNLMIMLEDAERAPDVVPCNSRVFKSIRGALSDQLHAHKFDVFDETTVTQGNFKQGRCGRTDAELIDIARSLTRPPIDILVKLTAYARVEKLSYTAKMSARLTARMIQVHSGNALGSFEVTSPPNWTITLDCADDRLCVLEKLAGKANILAKDLGAVIAIKLDDVTDVSGKVTAAAPPAQGSVPNAYTLIFDNFCNDTILPVESSLVAFSGYVRHRPTNASGCRHEYWYESHIEKARLLRNLRRMLDYQDVKGTVTFSGNVFTVEKIATRGRQ